MCIYEDIQNVGLHMFIYVKVYGFPSYTDVLITILF